MKYAKMLAAVAVTAAAALAAVMTDGITNSEWVNVALAGTGAAAVFAAPNVPGARYTKGVLAVLTAVGAFLASAILDGISPEEWLQILILGAGAVGITAVPNRGDMLDRRLPPAP